MTQKYIRKTFVKCYVKIRACGICQILLTAELLLTWCALCPLVCPGSLSQAQSVVYRLKLVGESHSLLSSSRRCCRLARNSI